MRTKETVEAALASVDENAENAASDQSPDEPSEQRVKEKIPNSEYIKPWQWKKGQSGNPGGRPKRDVSSEIARAVFEKNPELVYAAMAKLLKKGSAFGFQVLSDRAYGKLTDKVEVGATEDLIQRIMEGRKRMRGEHVKK